MNRRILLFLILCMTSILSFAQIEVPQEQRSMITKVSATWCSNCGNWGWTLMDGLVEDNADKALIVGAHYSGNLQTDESVAFGNNFNVNGQPKFVLNNTDIGANSSNIAAKRTEVADQVAANFTQSPIVNTGLEAMMSPDNQIVLRTNTQFFQATSGDYYLGLYVLENNVEENQAGSVADDIHPNVMRKAFGDTFGSSLASGSIDAGMSVEATYTMPMNSDWNMDNLVLAAIIWEKVGDDYQFVNAHSVTEFVPFVSTNELEASAIDFQLAPTIVQESAIMTFDLEQAATASVQVFDTNGRLVQRVFEGQLTAGQQQFEIGNNDLSGLYFVHLQLDGKILTEKILFE